MMSWSGIGVGLRLIPRTRCRFSSPGRILPATLTRLAWIWAASSRSRSGSRWSWRSRWAWSSRSFCRSSTFSLRVSPSGVVADVAVVVVKLWCNVQQSGQDFLKSESFNLFNLIEINLNIWVWDIFDTQIWCFLLFLNIFYFLFISTSKK